jgi:glycosyltransferase involved in cell wall biosynthesis
MVSFGQGAAAGRFRRNLGMKVLYDGAIYAVQQAGGANRYWAKVIDHMPEDVVPYLATNQIRSTNYPGNPRLKTYYFKRFGFRPGRASFCLEKLFFRAVMLGQPFDIFHPSIYTENAAQVPLRKFRCPIVITILDMIEELYPESDPSGLRQRQKAQALAAASAVICISHNTKKDLLERYPNLKAPITVTHLASELNSRMAEGDEPVPDRPYFLYVGARHAAYKNFDGLLAAFDRIAKECPEVVLCLAGPPLTADEQRSLAGFELQDRVHHAGQPGDSHLAKLYRCSLALVYPSLYEGFGIPPLEAMACGTIAVAANRASLPEIMGDAGLLFNPLAADDLAQILSAIARGEINRAEMIERGSRRAAQFSWERTAAQTYTVYHNLGVRTQNPPPR